jgi:hypothetical protein
MVSMRETETDEELYSLPDGAFGWAEKLSLELSGITDGQ